MHIRVGRGLIDWLSTGLNPDHKFRRKADNLYVYNVYNVYVCTLMIHIETQVNINVKKDTKIRCHIKPYQIFTSVVQQVWQWTQNGKMYTSILQSTHFHSGTNLVNMLVLTPFACPAGCHFYRTQVSLGSCLWVSASLPTYKTLLKLCWCDSGLWWYQFNTIDDANIKQSLAICNQCHIYASRTGWWSKQNCSNFGGKMKYKSDYKKRVDTKTRNTTSRVLQNTQKQLRGQREQTKRLG